MSEDLVTIINNENPPINLEIIVQNNEVDVAILSSLIDKLNYINNELGIDVLNSITNRLNIMDNELDTKEPLKGVDDNYVTGTQLTVLNSITGNLNDINSELDTKEPLKGANDNYVTGAQLNVLSNTSGTNTGDETNSSIITKIGYTPANNSNTPTISSGAVSPTSTPSKIGDIYVDTANYKTYVAKGTTSSSDWIKQNGSYSLQALACQGTSPSDGSTIYFGGFGYWATAGANYRKIYIPKSGVITSVYGMFYQTAGSGETSSLYMRHNSTTDYLVSSSIVNNSTLTSFSNSSLNIPVSAGDYIEFKWVCPTWVTNPTAVTAQASIGIDL